MSEVSTEMLLRLMEEKKKAQERALEYVKYAEILRNGLENLVLFCTDPTVLNYSKEVLTKANESFNYNVYTEETRAFFNELLEARDANPQ